MKWDNLFRLKGDCIRDYFNTNSLIYNEVITLSVKSYKDHGRLQSHEKAATLLLEVTNANPLIETGHHAD